MAPNAAKAWLRMEVAREKEVEQRLGRRQQVISPKAFILRHGRCFLAAQGPQEANHHVKLSHFASGRGT
jgi:hypothetical protein